MNGLKTWPSDGHFPVLVGEILTDPTTGRRGFPFKVWARECRFKYPPEAAGFLSHCGSAAEAFFARAFTLREGVEYPRENLAVAGGLAFELQVRCGSYWIDALVSDDRSSLAIEIDGLAFHHHSEERVAEDYLRQRRIVLKGHTLIRFTAQEVFHGAGECWRQVEEILAARRRA